MSDDDDFDDGQGFLFEPEVRGDSRELITDHDYIRTHTGFCRFCGKQERAHAIIPPEPMPTKPVVMATPVAPTPITQEFMADRHARTIEGTFARFHAANPHVYVKLVEMTRDLVERGHRVVGMKMLFEVLRWSWMLSTDDPGSEFKLCNNYTSRYARFIMANEPDLDGVYVIRELKTV